MTAAQVIINTEQWIESVVIGCNFCPFAANVMKQRSVHYQVEESLLSSKCLESFLPEAARLDNEPGIETIFLIFPNCFAVFDDYLDLVEDAEQQLADGGYEGIYQVAGFHPQYRFADSLKEDAADYTNRSVYPMLHLLREESIDNALAFYKDPEGIPGRNIDFARKKGLTYMKMLRDNCTG